MCGSGKSIPLIFVFTLFCLVCPSRHASAQHPVDSLRGLEAVFVYVEPLSPEIEKKGLTRDQIERDVNWKLRDAGINVLTRNQFEAVRGQPFLHVIAAVTENPLSGKDVPKSYAYSVQVYLRQTVYLQRDVDIVVKGSATWQPPIFSWGVTSNLGEIRDMVRAQVEAFIKDWQVTHR